MTPSKPVTEKRFADAFRTAVGCNAEYRELVAKSLEGERVQCLVWECDWHSPRSKKIPPGFRRVKLTLLVKDAAPEPNFGCTGFSYKTTRSK